MHVLSESLNGYLNTEHRTKAGVSVVWYILFIYLKVPNPICAYKKKAHFFHLLFPHPLSKRFKPAQLLCKILVCNSLGYESDVGHHSFSLYPKKGPN